MTGFAARYLPAAIQSVLDNPDVIGRDVLDTMGFQEDGPLGALVGQNLGFFVDQILPLLYFGDAIGKTPSAGGMVNRTADYARNLATPGGGLVDPMEILKLVLAEASKAPTAAQTIGSGLFAGQTPGQQRSSLVNIIDQLANWAPNPTFARSIRNVGSNLGTEFVRRASQAQSPYTAPIGQFYRDNIGALP